MDERTLNAELLEQYILAGSVDTPPEQLRVLADHFCDKIRMRVAENPNTPADVLRNLVRDPNHDVRIALACNPAIERDLLVRLMRDGDVSVRHGLAQEITTPVDILEELAQDDNAWVRGEAEKTLHIVAHQNRLHVVRPNRGNVRSLWRAKSGEEAAS